MLADVRPMFARDHAMLARYRALGADLPFGDRRRGHGVAMEGYFWRLTDARSGRVVVALCGVCRAGAATWATVALAAEPGGLLAAADLPHARADPDRLGAHAHGPAGRFDGDADGVRVDLGPGARLDVSLADRSPVRTPMLGGVGIAHLVPGLGQYWDPYLLDARTDGHAELGGAQLGLDGFRAYAEKNWSSTGGFPERWWWGQAGGFARGDVAVAFAGGAVTIGPATHEATGIVVALGGRLIRLGNPLLAPVRADVDGRHWSLRSRGPLWSVELAGTAGAGEPVDLPVPLPAGGYSLPAAHHHLAARLAIVVRRRGRVVFAGESPLAGLELGLLDGSSGTQGGRLRPGRRLRRSARVRRRGAAGRARSRSRRAPRSRSR